MVAAQSKAGAELLEKEWVVECVEMIKNQQSSIESIVPQDEVRPSVFVQICYNLNYSRFKVINLSM